MKPETVKLLKDTTASVLHVDKENKAIQASYKHVRESLEAAIKDGSEPEIELYRPKLDQVVAAMDDCMISVQGALALIGLLEKDEELASTRFADIEKLMKTVAGTRTTLTRQLAEARDLGKRAGKALDSAAGSRAEAERELAVLKSRVREVKRVVDHARAESARLAGLAKRALAARDQNALTDARLKLIDLLGYRDQIKWHRQTVDAMNAFLKKNVADAKDLFDEVEALNGELKGMDVVMKDVDTLLNAVTTLGEVVPINLGKAIKVLGLAPKDQARLDRIFSGPQAGYEKGLAALARDHKLASSGKSMLESLRKEKVLTP